MKPHEVTLERIQAFWPLPTITRDHQCRPTEVPGVTRDKFAELLFHLGFTIGVEVGVERGKYSEVLLHANPLLMLHLVDPWQHYNGYRDHVSQDKLDGFYNETVRRLSGKFGRARFWRGYSVDVAKDFAIAKRYVDFVYIDGNHTIEHVIADLAAWTPLVRPGGIVAGHDYRKPKNNIGHAVVEAVNAWTYAKRISPWYLMGRRSDTERDRNRSFFWVKE